MLEDEILSELKVGLFAGHYNLLLGSGASLDSFGSDRQPLIGAKTLTRTLNDLKGVDSGTPLSRVSLLLSPDEVKTHLTDRYRGCRPGETVQQLPKFLWKSIYSFNIDDCVEAAYEADIERAQSLDSINFNASFRTPDNASTLSLIHLHGWVRDAEVGYVFSTSQYGKVTREINPWMQVLSELIASEPFIISGTSLNEPDLEFYLASRNENSPRANRGPSILVEPYPDAITHKLCQQHNLVLVQATLADFLKWLGKKFGKSPTLADLVVPPISELFYPVPSSLSQVAFFSAFDLIRPLNGSPEDGKYSAFFYGREPTWRDLAASVDVPTQDDQNLSSAVREFLDHPQSNNAIYMLSAEPGTGKSTCIRRVAYDLARSGKVVFSLKAGSTINTEHVLSCLANVRKPFVVLIDRAGDHVTLMHTLALSDQISTHFLILAADRAYRENHIERTLGNVELFYFDSFKWTESMLFKLIEQYRMRGLVGATGAIRDQSKFANSLKNDVVAIATCRILNDFKPLEKIVKSIWNDATPVTRRTYLTVALAHHCNPVGITYSILQAAQDNPDLKKQFDYFGPLPLSYSPDNDDYVIPLNTTIADKILTLTSSEKSDLLLEAFINLANAIAPYVNRRTSIQGIPEARLAGRLFNAEKVVKHLLGLKLGGKFYETSQARWEWNSRYWEQRALFTQAFDLDLAVQYARQAVAIEGHPFPWTTLASVLIRKLETAPSMRDALFLEAYESLKLALRREEVRDWRPTAPPYATLFHGTLSYLREGGRLSSQQLNFINDQIGKAQHFFVRDLKLQAACTSLLSAMSS